MKRYISSVLTMALLFLCICPFSAIAQEDETVLVEIALTESEFSELIEIARESGFVEFNISESDPGAAGLTVSIIPSWLNDTGLGLFLALDSGYSFTLPAAVINELSVSFPDEPLDFTLFRGSLGIHVTRGGESTYWYDFRNPTLATMPYDLVKAAGSYTVFFRITDQGEQIVPRFWFDNGLVFAKVYEPGEFDVKYTVGFVFDDTDGKWMQAPVNYLAIRGIVNGVGGGLFDPSGSVTRAQFVTMLMRTFGTLPIADNETPFTDQDAIPEWAIEHILTAKNLGIAQGDENGNFNPNEKVSRQEIFVMAYRALEEFNLLPEVFPEMEFSFTDSDEIADYAVEAIENLSRLGLVSGYNNMIYPREYSTRAEAAQFLFNILRYDAEIL